MSSTSPITCPRSHPEGLNNRSERERTSSNQWARLRFLCQNLTRTNVSSIAKTESWNEGSARWALLERQGARSKVGGALDLPENTASEELADANEATSGYCAEVIHSGRPEGPVEEKGRQEKADPCGGPENANLRTVSEASHDGRPQEESGERTPLRQPSKEVADTKARHTEEQQEPQDQNKVVTSSKATRRFLECVEPQAGRRVLSGRLDRDHDWPSSSSIRGPHTDEAREAEEQAKLRSSEATETGLTGREQAAEERNGVAGPGKLIPEELLLRIAEIEVTIHLRDIVRNQVVPTRRCSDVG